MNKPYQQFYEFGFFRVLPEERKLLRQGESVALTTKSFDLLLFLLRNGNRILGKDEILKAVWPDVVVEENTLSVNIFALRKALEHGGQDGDKSKFIETVPKQGYRFNAEIKESQPPKKKINSLAILPLINANADARVEYLADGITESVINNLSRLPQLRVMARSTVFRYKSQDVDPKQVGRALNVSAVLVGRILLFGHKLIIRVELVEVESGWQIWGEQYNLPTSNILMVQQDISQTVSEQIRLNLTGKQKQSLTKRQTKNNEAYRVYLKGRYFLGKRTNEGIKTGLEFFQMAIDIDPRYALAYVGIADCYNLLLSYGTLAPKDSYPKIKEAARKALQIDAGLAEAHASLGHAKMFELDWEGAEREFKRAVKVDSDCPTAHHWYAVYLIIRGRFDEALTEIKCALRLDPLSLIINSSLAGMYYIARHYDQAIAQANETLNMDANFIPALAVLGAAYAQKGIYGKAITALKKSISVAPNPEVLGILGHTYAISGKRSDARRVLKQLQEHSKQSYVGSAHMGIIYAGLNERDAAFECLEKAFEEGFLMSTAANHPVLDNLRADARLTELRRRLRLN